MPKEEKRYIGQSCYLCLASKPELFCAENQQRIRLGPTEYRVLSFFMDNADSPVYREELARHIWGFNYEADGKQPSSLDTQISRIRTKLNQISPGLGACIVTNHGMASYTFESSRPEGGQAVSLSELFDAPQAPPAPSISLSPTIRSARRGGKKRFCLLRESTGERILLPEGMFLLGRNPRKCGYCLEGQDVSFVHACITVKDGAEPVLTDMNSVTGTFLNSSRLLPMRDYELEQDDRIGIGGEAFTFCDERAQTPPRQEFADTVTRLEDAVLQLALQTESLFQSIAHLHRLLTSDEGTLSPPAEPIPDLEQALKESLAQKQQCQRTLEKLREVSGSDRELSYKSAILHRKGHLSPRGPEKRSKKLGALAQDVLQLQEWVNRRAPVFQQLHETAAPSSQLASVSHSVCANMHSTCAALALAHSTLLSEQKSSDAAQRQLHDFLRDRIKFKDD